MKAEILDATLNNKQITITSREVSEWTGKLHKNVLSTISKYVEVLTGSKLSPLDYFVESTYVDGKGETRKQYLLTKMGCEMVANKMTGDDGILFTAKYVSKFNEMEQQNPYEGLSKELQAIFVLDRKQQDHERRLDKLEKDMPLFNVECKELQSLVKKKGTEVLGGYKTNAYNDKSLRTRVYTDIQKQLKREFSVSRYEAIKHSQIEIAKQIISNYKLPFVLAD